MATLLALSVSRSEAALYRIEITGAVISIDSADLNSAGVRIGDRTRFEALVNTARAIDQFPSSNDLYQAQNFYGWSANYGGFEAKSARGGAFVSRTGNLHDSFSLSSFDGNTGPNAIKDSGPPSGYEFRGISNILIGEAGLHSTTEPDAILHRLVIGALTLADYQDLESHIAFQAYGSDQFTRAFSSMDTLKVSVVPVPLPPSLLLLVAGLFALAFCASRVDKRPNTLPCPRTAINT